MKLKKMCGAYSRSTGKQCNAKALQNGRCRNHGGMSTGPKTAQGRKAIGDATRERMASGQRDLALAGFYRWLEAGGRLLLSSVRKSQFPARKT